MRRTVLVALAAVLAVGAPACASSDSSSNSDAASSTRATSAAASGPTASAPVCRAADDVRASLSDLQGIDVVQQGTAAVQQAFTQVKSDLAALSDAARGQHAEQVQQVKTDTDAVQAALDQATANPNAQTVGAVATAGRTLAQDTQALLAAVGSSC